MSAAIIARGLTHGYGEGPVLRALELDVAAGEVLFLMGPSGCGKTTLLTLIGALRSVQEGQLHVLGHALHGVDDAARVASRRRTGFVFQHHNLHRSLTALQNVMVGLEARGLSRSTDATEMCRAALAAVGLAGLDARRQDKLSGGQRQRVAIARALVGGPQLLLADEPTGALDSATGREVMAAMRGLARAQGTTVVIVTHDPRLHEPGDRVIAMEDGQIRSMERELAP